MKVRLITDFHDYYDHWFDPHEGVPFERLTRSGLSRRDMLSFLLKSGFRVPLFGVLSQIAPALPVQGQVVVYLDENAHRGDGKILLPLEKALVQYPDHLAIQYVGFHPRVSLRYLQVGNLSFWLRYESNDDWRSNVGDGTVRVIQRNSPGYHKTLTDPLFAVDFVLGRTEQDLFAIDYNIAPGLRGSGVEKILRPLAAAQAIQKAVLAQEKAQVNLHEPS